MARLGSAPSAPVSLVALALVLVLVPAAYAAWPNDPHVNVRVCTDNNPHLNPALCTDGDGGAIIAWHDQRDYGTNGYDIYVQRITDRGTVASGWPATGVALCTATNDQVDVVVVSDGTGGAYVAWKDLRSGEFDIYATRVTAQGTVAAGWPADGLAVCTATGEQTDLQGVADGYGRAYLVWNDGRQSDTNIFAQRLEPDGTTANGWATNGLSLCSAGGDQIAPACAADGFGGLLAVWEDHRSGIKVYGIHETLTASVATGWTGDGNALGTVPSDQFDPILVADGVGGGIVAWRDDRTNDFDYYALRFTSTGALASGWAADGEALTAVTGSVAGISGAPDGTGGAIFAWADYANDVYGDIYAQRIDGSGTPQWATNGTALCALPYFQDTPDVISDGVGGALVAWTDTRSLSYSDVMGVRLTSGGALVSGWSTNGTAISTAEGGQFLPHMVPDGAGGAIVLFGDSRSSLDVYVQRVDRFGELGAQPTITGVTDVPNDQGGQVKVSWTASPLDAFPDYAIDSYWVLRAVPSSAIAGLADEGVPVVSRDGSVYVTTEDHGASFAWELIATVSSLHTASYSVVAPTTGDSTGGSNPMTAFMIQARNSFGSMWFDSDPDSGYSVDDLAPAAPAPFAGEYQSGTTTLHWGLNVEPDFGSYRLYRGTDPGFVPGPGNLVSEQPDTGYVDVDAGGPYVYKLAAVDVHGNVSPYAVLTPGMTTDVPAGTPGRLWLGPGAPNPSAGPMAVDFGLARGGPVVVTILDLGGREVRRLLDGTLPAGAHRVAWDGGDGAGRLVPSGIYFVQMRTDRQRLQRKLVVAR